MRKPLSQEQFSFARILLFKRNGLNIICFREDEIHSLLRRKLGLMRLRLFYEVATTPL